jgi:hypothetical protein
MESSGDPNLEQAETGRQGPLPMGHKEELSFRLSAFRDNANTVLTEELLKRCPWRPKQRQNSMLVALVTHAEGVRLAVRSPWLYCTAKCRKG